MTRLIVHMGLQKTGSTALHHFLQANEAALVPDLCLLTPRKETPARDLGRRAALYSLDPVGEEAGFLAAMAPVRQQVETCHAAICLLSHENLPGAMPGRGGTSTLYPRLEDIIARLDAHLGGRPDYVIYTRDLAAWKRSVHNQAIRSDGYARDWGAFQGETAGITDWQALHDRLDRATQGRAHVFRLEDEPDPDRPGQQLLRLAGLSQARIDALAPLKSRRNESLRSGALEFMRQLNGLDLAPAQRRRVARLVEANPALFAST